MAAESKAFKAGLKAPARARNPRPLLLVLLVLLLLVVLPIVAVALFGTTAPIDEGLPAVGVVPTSIPFSGQGYALITVQWQVRGGESEDPLLTGAYFGGTPSEGEFTTATAPENAGYEGFVAGQEAALSGITVHQAELPNMHNPLYVRLYAFIDGKHYWSQEYPVDS
jgi:hypothetical protein